MRAECEDYRQRTDSRYGMWAGQIRNDDKDDDDE